MRRVLILALPLLVLLAGCSGGGTSSPSKSEKPSLSLDGSALVVRFFPEGTPSCTTAQSTYSVEVLNASSEKIALVPLSDFYTSESSNGLVTHDDVIRCYSDYSLSFNADKGEVVTFELVDREGRVLDSKVATDPTEAPFLQWTDTDVSQ